MRTRELLLAGKQPLAPDGQIKPTLALFYVAHAKSFVGVSDSGYIWAADYITLQPCGGIQAHDRQCLAVCRHKARQELYCFFACGTVKVFRISSSMHRDQVWSWEERPVPADAFTCTCMPACLHACMPACLHACMHIRTCVRTCMHARIHACVHTCTHTDAHTHVHTCPCMRGYIRTCTPACLHAHMHIHAYRQTGKRTYARIHRCHTYMQVKMRNYSRTDFTLGLSFKTQVGIRRLCLLHLCMGGTGTHALSLLLHR